MSCPSCERPLRCAKRQLVCLPQFELAPSHPILKQRKARKKQALGSSTEGSAVRSPQAGRRTERERERVWRENRINNNTCRGLVRAHAESTGFPSDLQHPPRSYRSCATKDEQSRKLTKKRKPLLVGHLLRMLHEAFDGNNFANS